MKANGAEAGSRDRTSDPEKLLERRRLMCRARVHGALTVNSLLNELIRERRGKFPVNFFPAADGIIDLFRCL